ncbi:hypothetical protein ACFODZ_03590 [Marinicella sediminis]|uniref:Uncharacterized protein n=1 Tax=Marinicella sediminis TaxID=1792834 RepID=A0ABV7J570_9GAMM|nr:hypothetical protein [Marinicella sediminis]
MMKQVYLILLLLSATATQAEQGLSREEQANLELLAWEHGFYRHLLEQKNPELQAYGLFLFHPNTFDPPAAERVELLTPVMNSLVKRQDLNLHTMWLINDLCRSDQVYPDCDINLLNDHMFKQHGDQLLPYIRPLNQAMRAGIEGEVFDWVNRMAEASSFQLKMDNSPLFIETLDQYATDHPLPTGYLYEHLGVGQLTDLDDYSAEQLKYLHDNASGHLLLVMKINFSMIMPVPAFRGLLDACDTYQELSQACVTIGRILAGNDDQYLSTAIGHKIQSTAWKLAGQNDPAMLAEQTYHAYQKEITCLNNQFTFQVIGKMDLDFMRDNMKIKREQGERTALIHAARYFHQQKIQQGIPADELQSPEDCLYQPIEQQSAQHP